MTKQQIPAPMQLRLSALNQAWALLTRDRAVLPSASELTEFAQRLAMGFVHRTGEEMPPPARHIGPSAPGHAAS